MQHGFLVERDFSVTKGKKIIIIHVYHVYLYLIIDYLQIRQRHDDIWKKKFDGPIWSNFWLWYEYFW